MNEDKRMFDKRYPPLDPRSHSPDSLAALAMKASAQARQAAAGSHAGAVPPLTTEQIGRLIEDGRQASYGVTNKRMEVESLLRERERQRQWRGPEPYLMSNASQRAEETARSYFGSASDKWLGEVDKNLAAVERDLRLPDAAAGGAHPYRSFQPHELAEQKEKGFAFAAGYHPGQPGTIGVNYPLYSRAHPASYPLETQVHEWLHLLGQNSKGELYGKEAVTKAAEQGGTEWSVRKNPENTAMYVFRPGPFLYGIP